MGRKRGATPEPLREFCEALRQLKVSHEDPTLEFLSRKMATKPSRSSLSELFTGKISRAPDWERVHDLIITLERISERKIDKERWKWRHDELVRRLESRAPDRSAESDPIEPSEQPPPATSTEVATVPPDEAPPRSRRQLVISLGVIICAAVLVTGAIVLIPRDQGPEIPEPPKQRANILIKSASADKKSCVRYHSDPLPSGSTTIGACDSTDPEWSMWTFSNNHIRFISLRRDGVCLGADTSSSAKPVGTWDCYHLDSSWLPVRLPDGSYFLENDQAADSGAAAKCAARRGSRIRLDTCTKRNDRTWFLPEAP